MYSKIRNPITNRLVSTNSTLGKKIILNFIKNINKLGGASLATSEKTEITNAAVLDDLIKKKSENINILLGANVNDVNAQKGSWDLCISNGIGFIDGEIQQINWPEYQQIDENIPGQVILDWNNEEEMKVLSKLKGMVKVIVFDWSSSGSEFWNGGLSNLIPLLQINGKIFIEEYIKAMNLIGTFSIPKNIVSYLNGNGIIDYNSLLESNMQSSAYTKEKNKILFGGKNSDLPNNKKVYDGSGIFNLDINKNLLIEPSYKTKGYSPDSKDVISLFRDVYIKTIPNTFNYYLKFQELIEKNNNIISTLRLQTRMEEKFFPFSPLQFDLKQKLINKKIITPDSQFKYFYKRTRKSENEDGSEGLVETFPTEEFHWIYPVTDPTTGKEINSFHVIQRLY